METIYGLGSVRTARLRGLPDCEGEEPKKTSTYNKEKYEANKEKILAYRKRRYREINAYKYDIQINQGNFIIYFN
jgi:hypothetical protein